MFTLTRKIKHFSPTVGPFGGGGLMVEADGPYKLFVYDRILEEGSSLGNVSAENQR